MEYTKSKIISFNTLIRMHLKCTSLFHLLLKTHENWLIEHLFILALHLT